MFTFRLLPLFSVFQKRRFFFTLRDVCIQILRNLFRNITKKFHSMIKKKNAQLLSSVNKFIESIRSTGNMPLLPSFLYILILNAPHVWRDIIPMSLLHQILRKTKRYIARSFEHLMTKVYIILSCRMKNITLKNLIS